MKPTHFLLFTMLSISVYSQVITFDKTITAGAQVWQTSDNGYILNNGISIFQKIDANGYKEWNKGYQLPIGSNVIPKVIKTLDGGYAAAGSKLNGSYEDIWFIKLDQNFDTVWTNIYGSPDQREEGTNLIQLPDSSYIISSIDYTLGIFLRKINADGSLVWAKKVSNLALAPKYYLINLDTDNFLFGRTGTGGKIIKFNSNADTLWIKNNITTNNSYLTNDEHILLSTTTFLQKLDLDGNAIWQIPYGNIKAFVQPAGNNYVLIQGTDNQPFTPKILKIDTSGNLLFELPLREFYTNNNYAIITSSDGGFAISTGNRFLKTDADFNYTAINLEYPADGERIYTFSIFTQHPIYWHSSNVNYVNIDYSTDNQTTWNNIISYYPANADTFNWEIPVLPDGEFFIRISDSFNPDIYDRSDPPQIITNQTQYAYIAANEIFMWMSNNGMNAHDPRTDGSGFYWPGGENATISAIFEDGLVWGGKVNGEIRVNGATYRQGLKPGYIMSNGLPSDSTDINSRIFKLKKNWQYLPPGPERDRYEFDFLHWPVDVGAPWTDNNDDGIYTPGIDEPKIIGDETIFFVANDLDTVRSLFTYGSDPIGLEFQSTTFAYNSELLKDVVFKKYKIINKSSNTINDMYFTYWADDDLGFAGDDYEGFDSTLNLSYCFNADNYDEGYYETPPPAIGHMLIQGPIIPGLLSDSARFGDGWKSGYRNIEMTSSGMMFKNYQGYGDPYLGDYQGTLQFYNMMQGFKMDGSTIINPITNQPTIWPLCGDPISGIGWYEGVDWPEGPLPGDRRYHLPTGLFNMAPSDTQEVAVAILIKKGTDNINSIAVLKDYAAQIQHWYDNDFVTDVNDDKKTIPADFSLSQNYPNPFNPSTTISYQLPTNSKVTLKIYDILGSEVATLVNQEQSAGTYNLEFNASHLSSGVYFYQLKVTDPEINSGQGFIQTKKMVLVK